MGDYEIREYYIEDPELPKLYMQSWVLKNKPSRGCVLITHGISEHSECYDHMAKALADKGWMTFVWDLQGHGKSQGKRGYIENFMDFSRDLNSVVKKIKQNEKLPTSNFHLVGHSMGGLITLCSLLSEKPPRIQSVTLSNPALGLAMEVPKIKEIASQWLNQIWPTFTMENEIRYHLLSRDPAMLPTYEKDPLRHRKISAPLYLGMVEAMDFVKKNIHKLQVPVHMQVAGKDQIINPQANLDLYKNIQCEKKLDLYEESFHELYNDLNKQQTIDDLERFLGEYSS